MRKSIIFCLMLIVFLSGSALAQFDVGLNLTVISPEKEFKENVNRLGFGLTGKFAVKLWDTPFYAGLSIGGANYGSESRREILVWPVEVEVTTNNNFLFSHLLLQARSNLQPIQPYVEGLLGLNYLWTESKIKDIDEYEEDIASQTHFNDFTWSYGAGFGILIKLKSFDVETDTPENKKGRLFLDFRARYMFGGEAEYLKEGSIKKGENDKVIYDVSKSSTDFVSFHLGVVVNIF